MTISMNSKGGGGQTTQDGFIELIRSTTTPVAINEIDTTDFRFFSSNGLGYGSSSSSAAFGISMELTSSTEVTFRSGSALGGSITARLDYGVFAREV